MWEVITARGAGFCAKIAPQNPKIESKRYRKHTMKGDHDHLALHVRLRRNKVIAFLKKPFIMKKQNI